MGRLSQWLQRTNKWWRLTTSTGCCCTTVLVDFVCFAAVIEWLIDRNSFYLLAADAAGMKRNILSVTRVPFGIFSVGA